MYSHGQCPYEVQRIQLHNTYLSIRIGIIPSNSEHSRTPRPNFSIERVTSKLLMLKLEDRGI